jgi:hypothetical protein
VHVCHTTKRPGLREGFRTRVPSLRPEAAAGYDTATMMRSLHRLIRGGLAVGLVIVLVGIAIHVAHHATDLGKSSPCPVLAAAQQLPWSPAEAPDVWIVLAVAAAPATVLAESCHPARPPRVDRGRAPPPLRVA